MPSWPHTSSQQGHIRCTDMCSRALRPSWSRTSSQQKSGALTMAFSWELLACVIPRMLVVCITSTEKLGSQLAIRDPKTSQNPTQQWVPWCLPPCRQCVQSLYWQWPLIAGSYLPGLPVKCSTQISLSCPHENLHGPSIPLRDVTLGLNLGLWSKALSNYITHPTSHRLMTWQMWSQTVIPP